MTRSDATDHPSHQNPLSRWPLPPLIAATTALTTAAVALALVGPASRGTTDAEEPALQPARLAPAQAQRARAQATADRFARTFARSLRTPVPARELRAAGASPQLAHRIAGEPSRSTRASLGARSRTSTADPSSAIDVVVRADRGGWLATATILVDHPRHGDDKAQQLPLTFRLEPRQDHPRALLVVDANSSTDR